MLKASVGAAVDIILKDYCMDLYTKRTKKSPNFATALLILLFMTFIPAGVGKCPLASFRLFAKSMLEPITISPT